MGPNTVHPRLQPFSRMLTKGVGQVLVRTLWRHPPPRWGTKPRCRPGGAGRCGFARPPCPCQRTGGGQAGSRIRRHGSLLPHNDLEVDAQLGPMAAVEKRCGSSWTASTPCMGMAPLQALMERLERFPHFHLYVDDTHGMSWVGVGAKAMCCHMDLHDRMVLATSLNKAFCNRGPSSYREWHGPLAGLLFGSDKPPMMGAAIASTKLHLSGALKPLKTAGGQHPGRTGLG